LFFPSASAKIGVKIPGYKRIAMSFGDDFGTGKNTGNNSGRDAIVKVLRRYFDRHASRGNNQPAKSNEDLIVKALKNYFKGDAWT
jgi:hypothetical protein